MLISAHHYREWVKFLPYTLEYIPTATSLFDILAIKESDNPLRSITPPHDTRATQILLSSLLCWSTYLSVSLYLDKKDCIPRTQRHLKAQKISKAGSSDDRGDVRANADRNYYYSRLEHQPLRVLSAIDTSFSFSGKARRERERESPARRKGTTLIVPIDFEVHLGAVLKDTFSRAPKINTRTTTL